MQHSGPRAVVASVTTPYALQHSGPRAAVASVTEAMRTTPYALPCTIPGNSRWFSTRCPIFGCYTCIGLGFTDHRGPCLHAVPRHHVAIHVVDESKHAVAVGGGDNGARAEAEAVGVAAGWCCRQCAVAVVVHQVRCGQVACTGYATIVIARPGRHDRHGRGAVWQHSLLGRAPSTETV